MKHRINVRVMLLRYFTVVYLVHISTHYFICNVMKHVLPLE